MANQLNSTAHANPAERQNTTPRPAKLITVRTWRQRRRERRRERRALIAMSARELRELGLARSTATEEYDTFIRLHMLFPGPGR